MHFHDYHYRKPKKLYLCFFILLIINAYIVTVLATLEDSYNLRMTRSPIFQKILGKGYRRNLFGRL